MGGSRKDKIERRDIGGAMHLVVVNKCKGVCEGVPLAGMVSHIVADGRKDCAVKLNTLYLSVPFRAVRRGVNVPRTNDGADFSEKA